MSKLLPLADSYPAHGNLPAGAFARLHRWLEAPTPAEPLAVFRLVFGAMMFVGTLRFCWLGWVDDHYLAPKFHFTYYGFEWVQVPPAPVLYAMHGLMLLAALGIALGAWYRLSALVFFLVFTYTELIELAYYLNHYYFVSLVSLLLIFVPAHRCFSVDALRRPELRSAVVPRWSIGVFMAQTAIVYTYAGLAKINSDWLLHALPLRIWLPAHDDLPLIGPWLTLPATAFFFSWAGMLYDCFVVVFLFWPRTRWVAYATVVFFHTLTGLLFPIGIFPLVMMGSALLFFSPRFHRNLLDRIGRVLPKLRTSPAEVSAKPVQTARWVGPALALYLGVQVLFPWRYLLYPGNLFWTEEGYRFSWRVMLVEKAGTATFFVRDACTGREGVVDNREFLNAHQEKQMSFQPDMLLQFAHFLSDHYARQGLCSPQVRVEAYVTMNGRPSRLLVDPQRDLTRVRDGWGPRDWVLP
jgi:hypothetical protein